MSYTLDRSWIYIQNFNEKVLVIYTKPQLRGTCETQDYMGFLNSHIS